MSSFKNLRNKDKAILFKKNYQVWKQDAINNKGFFIIFNGFLEKEQLKKISGNALKLYIYLGLNAKNETGEVWHSTQTIANYFGKSERTIRSWMKELEESNLIKKMQMEFNGVSHVFLQPYDAGKDRKVKGK